MGELIVDFITSLDGYASAEGWSGWSGLEGPEYLHWARRAARGNAAHGCEHVPADVGLRRRLHPSGDR